MNNKGLAVKVGIFIISILVVFFVGQLWLMNFKSHRTGYIVNVSFNDVSGLKPGDPVRVYGIVKGKVLGMDVTEKGVIVSLWIEKDVKIKEDVKVSIRDVAMISGTKTIVLDPGKAEKPWDITKIITGQPSLGLSTIEIGSLATEFGKLVDITRSGLGKTSTTLDQLEKALRDLKILLEENRENIKSTIGNVEEDSDSLKLVLGRLNKTLRETNLILNKINSKQGSLGKFIYDDKLYENLSDASAELKALLQDIKKNPKRYFKLF